MMMAVGRGSREAPLRRSDLPWLAGAIVCGGGIGPVLLMFALADGSASRSSLLLNLEGVLTALLAWWVFREHLDKRIAAGMGVITVGAFVLAWKPHSNERVQPILDGTRADGSRPNGQSRPRELGE